MDLITDQNHKIAGYVANPETIPLHPAGDVFIGEARSAARLSIGNGPVENFSDLKDLIASLPSDSAMAAHVPPITPDSNSGRVAEEQRNVRLRTFVYAASQQLSNDYRLIIGRAPKTEPKMYMAAVVSGLPPSNSSAFSKLKDARDAFVKFLGGSSLGHPYHIYDSPIPIEIEGSLYFNSMHISHPSGPASLKDDLKTVWEIRPVIEIASQPNP